MAFTVVVPSSIAKMAPDTLALALTDSTLKSTQYAVHAVRSGREYFTAVVSTLNGMLSALSPHAASNFKVNGPVKVLRNACNREQASFLISSSKHGGLSVIAREENTKQTGKLESDDKKAGPVKTSGPTEPETEEAEETRDSELDSLRADVARLQAELRDTTLSLVSARAAQKQAEAATAAAEIRANAAEQRANAAEQRAKSAESALTKMKAAKIRPATGLESRNISATA